MLVSTCRHTNYIPPYSFARPLFVGRRPTDTPFTSPAPPPPGCRLRFCFCFPVCFLFFVCVDLLGPRLYSTAFVALAGMLLQSWPRHSKQRGLSTPQGKKMQATYGEIEYSCNYDIDTSTVVFHNQGGERRCQKEIVRCISEFFPCASRPRSPCSLYISPMTPYSYTEMPIFELIFGCRVPRDRAFRRA